MRDNRDAGQTQIRQGHFRELLNYWHRQYGSVSIAYWIVRYFGEGLK